MSRRCLIELQTWQCVLYLVGHLVAKRRVPERKGVSAAAAERGEAEAAALLSGRPERELLLTPFRHQKASLRKKSGGLGTVRCALRRREVAFSRSLQPAAPPDRHRERRQQRRILTAPLHASEFVCDLSVNGSMSRKMWRLRAPRDSRRLRTAAPALIYRQSDPQVVRVESRGKPLRWRTTVSTHALRKDKVAKWGGARCQPRRDRTPNARLTARFASGTIFGTVRGTPL